LTHGKKDKERREKMPEKKDCCCNSKGNKMEKFLEASLLLLLKKQCAHGYGLIEQLEPLGFSPDDMNLSTLYRTLRKMEEKDQVKSSWEAGGGGPKKRVYDITSQGIKDLEEWREIFEFRKKRIEKFLDLYEKQCDYEEVL
jgi:poly-beta-hydroxybutyrate-responsive repressor